MSSGFVVYLCNQFALGGEQWKQVEELIRGKIVCTVSVPKDKLPYVQDTISRTLHYRRVVLGTLPRWYNVSAPYELLEVHDEKIVHKKSVGGI